MSRFGAGIRLGVMAPISSPRSPTACFATAGCPTRRRGIFGYVSTHRDGWQVTAAELVRRGREGVDAVTVGLKQHRRPAPRRPGPPAARHRGRPPRNACVGRPAAAVDQLRGRAHSVRGPDLPGPRRMRRLRRARNRPRRSPRSSSAPPPRTAQPTRTRPASPGGRWTRTRRMSGRRCPRRRAPPPACAPRQEPETRKPSTSLAPSPAATLAPSPATSLARASWEGSTYPQVNQGFRAWSGV